MVALMQSSGDEALVRSDDGVSSASDPLLEFTGPGLVGPQNGSLQSLQYQLGFPQSGFVRSRHVGRAS